ncbi:uncharacterized protein BXZ73DRAFT_74090 [Epithele typhae]|uniref:uncharacterized protein n=1 Tax=Epithele typhae TaxID=378194 RepID=UPI0020072DAA|nr:uncharacterized protein BXZ73DRAFT_74090 [Epithele typhae]KAH9943030.1 hypothetical protein BXZ73DRAFT_74090 [Epithele typhae]
MPTGRLKSANKQFKTLGMPKLKSQVLEIVPGDFVSIRGDKERKLHEVFLVNKITNRVVLKRELKTSARQDKRPSGKSVPYSQCQLYVGEYEYPPEEGETETKFQKVFATRLNKSAPKLNYVNGRWEWTRFAVNTVPRLPDYSPETYEPVAIPWPTEPDVLKPDPGIYDTTADAVNEVTYSLPSSLLSARLLPGSRPSRMHVHKELANPHARAKKMARYTAFVTRRKALLEEMIQKEYANLNGRSKPAARADAIFRWHQHVAEERQAQRKQRWRKRGGEARLERRRERKTRKAARTNEKLRSLVLDEAQNQVIPGSGLGKRA